MRNKKNMRKLAIDLTYQPTGGTLTQIIEIIKNINSYDFEKVIFFVTSDNLKLFEGTNEKKIILKNVLFSNKSIIVRTIWAQIILPISLIMNRIDLLFCPGNISPILNSKKKVQWIGTIGPFENNFISSFALKEKIIILITKYLMIFSAYTSDFVIFESNYTRDLFVNKYKQKKEKSSVLHRGHHEFFKPVDTNNSKIFDEIDYNDYILIVSHLYPYKNIEILLESYFQLRLYEKDLYVLVAGSILDEKYYNKLKLLVDKYGISKHVKFLGKVEKDGLRELYSHCKTYVFTSPFENFAATLIEAMCCSAPIITTNTTAMPEACDDAALYFSPYSVKDLSASILVFLNDEKTRLIYKEASLKKSREYEVYSVIDKKINQLLIKIL
jgi:glycosyltransferase involved in cell wall biosynthesis